MFFELLLITGVIASIVVLLGAVIARMRGRRGSDLRVLRWLAGSWLVYLAIVAIVAVSTPQRVLQKGEERCFDEMCFAVADVARQYRLGTGNEVVQAKGQFYVVSIRVSSRARRRAQRENGIAARLWAPDRYYDVSPRGQHAWIAEHGSSPQLTDRLQPGQSIVSVQVFDVPAPGPGLGLVIDHGITPGFLVIGESPILHKPTVTLID